jgi:iron complex transport system permease protein
MELRMKKTNNKIKTLLVLITLSLISLIICPMIGINFISYENAFKNQELAFIFFSIRIPRTLLAFFVGGGLAVSGMIYQAVFRNPLADPYTLGVSSGASLGAALSIIAGVGINAFGLSFVTLGALLGAIASIVLVYLFACLKENNSNTIILAGVVIATICSGCIMFLYYVGNKHDSYRIIRWIMGGVDGANYNLLIFIIIPLAIFLIVTEIFMPFLDLLITGDLIAHSRGVNVKKTRNFFIIITAITIGFLVSACGPIGFVGIISPHACRIIMPGIRHRMLSVYSFLLGGSFLVCADALARTVAPPSEIPVGIITSIIGGPLFLIMLFREKNQIIL